MHQHPRCMTQSISQAVSNKLGKFRTGDISWHATVVDSCCWITFLSTALGSPVMQSRPSICIHSVCWTNRPLTLIFCMWVGHDHGSRGLKAKVLGWANAVSLTSIQGSWFSSTLYFYTTTINRFTTLCPGLPRWDMMGWQWHQLNHMQAICT